MFKHFIIKYILYPYIDLSFFLGRSLYNMRMQNLIKYMLQVRNFWRGFNLKHKLVDVLTIAVLAVLSGGETWDDMELYGKDRHSLLKKFFELPVGIPSHDTFNRVFSLLTPKSLETVSFTWSAPLLAAAGFLSLKSRSMKNPMR